MHPDWSHLKIVLAIHRAGNLTAAARLLNMDQTTVGRRLSALEAQLGATLFVRSKNGFSVTRQGELVTTHALAIEKTVSQMQNDLISDDEGVTGILRLQGNVWMLERLAETEVHKLLSDHPQLELRLSGRLPPASLSGEATISLWFDAPAVHSGFTKPLCSVPYGVFESITSPPAPDRWVMFKDDEVTGPSIAHEIRRRIGPDRTVRMTATDASLLRGAIRNGVGRGILPWCLAQDDPELRCLSGDRPEVERQLFAHLHPDTVDTKRVQLVLNWLRRVLPPLLMSRDVAEQARPKRK